VIRLHLLALVLALSLEGRSRTNVPAGFDVISASGFTLPNGLHVLFSRAPRRLGAAVALAYKIGAITEDPGNSGSAHVLEHLMTDAPMPGTGETFTSLVARAGGVSNAKTTFTTTLYFEYCLKSELAFILSLEAYRMRNLALTQTSLDHEKATAVNEYKSLNGRQPYGTAIEDALRLAAPSFEFSHSPTGTTETIGRLTLASVANVYRRYYKPGNAVLVVVADLSPQRVKRMVGQAFGNIEASDVEAVSMTAPSSGPSQKSVEEEANVPETRLDMLYRVRSGTVEERAADAVLEELLSNKIQHLAAPGIAAANVTITDQGATSLIWISALLRRGAAAESAIASISEAAGALSTAAINDADLALIRRNVIDRMSTLADDAIERARALALEAIEGRPVDSLTSIAAMELEMPNRLRSSIAELASKFHPFVLIVRPTPAPTATETNRRGKG